MTRSIAWMVKPDCSARLSMIEPPQMDARIARRVPMPYHNVVSGGT